MNRSLTDEYLWWGTRKAFDTDSTRTTGGAGAAGLAHRRAVTLAMPSRCRSRHRGPAQRSSPARTRGSTYPSLSGRAEVRGREGPRMAVPPTEVTMLPHELEERTLSLPPTTDHSIALITGAALRHKRFAFRLQRSR